MRIYSKVVLDWNGVVLGSDWQDWDGPVAECKGGGGTQTVQSGGQTSQEPSYNQKVYTNLAGEYLAPSLGSHVTGWTPEGYFNYSDPTAAFPNTSGVFKDVQNTVGNVAPAFAQQAAFAQGIPGQVANIPVQSASAAATQQLNQPFGLPYQALAERQLKAMRPAYGARGIADSGVAQQGETEALRDLNTNLALQEFQNRNQAIQTANSVYGADLQNQLLKAGGELGAISGAQGALSNAISTPLSLESQAASLESLPYDKLIQLLNAQTGGTSATINTQTGKTNTGTGVFGK